MTNNKLNTRIKQLILESSDIDAEKQKDIIYFLFSIFVQHPKDLLLLEDGIRVVKTKSSFITEAEFRIKLKFPDTKIIKYDEDKKSYKWDLDIDNIYNSITTINSCEMVRYKSNLFLNKPSIEINNMTRAVTVTTNDIHIKEPKKINISKKEREEIINDYKQHFTDFDMLLKLIIDMRFAKDKKASFLHIRVLSDWGKSFLSGLLKNLEIAVEFDYHHLMNKSTSDIHPIQIRNSFVLILDEFNNFSQEMKKISHEITLAAKYGMSETVELYLKILMSAEKSPSFTGAVDQQITNRVMVFDISDHKAVKLTDREVYKKFGNAMYMRVLEEYSFSSFKQQINKYMNMNEMEAYRVADIEVRKIYDKYKMLDMENLNESIVSILNQEIYEIVTEDLEVLNPAYKQIKQNIIKLDTGKYIGKIFIKQPPKVFELILKNSAMESEFKKMKFKLPNIIEYLNMVADYRKQNYRVEVGKRYKGIILDIEDEEDKKIPLEIEDKKGTVKNHYLTIHTEDKEPY